MNDFIWTVRSWFFVRKKMIGGLIWLGVALFLAYKVFSGYAQDVVLYSRNGLPETYQYLLGIWVAAGSLIAFLWRK
jgi:hypothetical protein